MTKEFHHVLKAWEIKHSRLMLARFLPVGQRFTLKISDKMLYNRLVDKGGRTWVGSVISNYHEGQIFKGIVNDSNDQVILEPI